MTRMSTIYSRFSYGAGTTLVGGGVSAKAYAGTAKEVSGMLADKIVGLMTIVITVFILLIALLTWIINHYRDNAILYKEQCDKATRSSTWLTQPSAT